MQKNRLSLSETASIVCLIKQFSNEQMYAQLTKVTYTTHIVCFVHWSNHETTKMNLFKITNIVCLLKSLINDQITPKSTQ